MTDQAHPVRRFFRIAALVVGAIIVLLFAFIGVLTVVRDAPDTRLRAAGDPEGPPAIDDPEFASSIELFTGAHMEPGNHTDLLASGNATYPRLWEAMRFAKHSITAQFYYAAPGQLEDSLVTILSERARAGVRVYVLQDAFGSNVPDSAVNVMKAAGVHVTTFRPVKWWNLNKAQNRSHVRALVMDGTTGFTGGFGFDDKWIGDGRHKDQWRDTNIRLIGQSVEQLQAAFDRGWAEATGELLVGDQFFPPMPSTPVAGAPASGAGPRALPAAASVQADSGAMTAGLVLSVPTFGPTANARLIALAIGGARHTLFISNAYFVPDASLLEHLLQAAKRGVDVRLLLPGENTDVGSTRYAARSWYETLLRNGIKVYEYKPSMLHAKTFVVDGLFSSVGSMNLDFRSLALNDEANLLVLDRTFGARMDSLYQEDLKYATPIDLAQFQRRGFVQKLKERYYRAIGKAL